MLPLKSLAQMIYMCSNLVFNVAITCHEVFICKGAGIILDIVECHTYHIILYTEINSGITFTEEKNCVKLPFKRPV